MGALFPATKLAWDSQRARTERTAILADRLVELDGYGTALAGAGERFQPRVEELMAELIAPARIRTLEQTGDGWTPRPSASR